MTGNRRGGRREELERGDFAYLVKELYTQAISKEYGRPAAAENVAAAPPAAQKLAAAFACLHQMVTDQMNKTSLEDAVATGLLEANDMIFALIAGSSHPVFDYVRGVASEQINKRPSLLDWWRQGLAVGLYRALGANRRASGVVEATFGKVGIKVARSTLGTWDSRFRQDGDRLPDALAEELRITAAQTGLALDEIAMRRFLFRAATYPMISAS